MIGEPLEARVELLRETGRMLFLRGLIVQEQPTIAAYGTCAIVASVHRRRLPQESPPAAPARGDDQRPRPLSTRWSPRASCAPTPTRPPPPRGSTALASANSKPSPKRGSILWRAARHASPTPPRGVYLWGGVGRGKSMLMDLFFGCLDIRRKRRVHFHEFMLEVHQRIAERAHEGSRRPDRRRSPRRSPTKRGCSRSTR